MTLLPLIILKVSLLLFFIHSACSTQLDVRIPSAMRMKMDAPPIEMPNRSKSPQIVQPANEDCDKNNFRELELGIVVDSVMCKKSGSAAKIRTQVKDMVGQAQKALNDVCVIIKLIDTIVYCDEKKDPYMDLKNQQSELVLQDFRLRFPDKTKHHESFDAVILITGFQDGTSFSGRAYRGGTCSTFKYGWIEEIHGALVAHEIAHLLGAQHDTTGLMTEAVDVKKPTIEQLSPFSQGEVKAFLSTIDADCVTSQKGNESKGPVATQPAQTPKSSPAASEPPTSPSSPPSSPPTPPKNSPAPTSSPMLQIPASKSPEMTSPSPSPTYSQTATILTPTATATSTQTPSTSTNTVLQSPTTSPSPTASALLPPTDGPTPSETPEIEDGFAKIPPKDPPTLNKFLSDFTKPSKFCAPARLICSEDVKTHIMNGGKKESLDSIVKITIRQTHGYFNIRATAYSALIVGFSAQLDKASNMSATAVPLIMHMDPPRSRFEGWVPVNKVQAPGGESNCCGKTMYAFVNIKLRFLDDSPEKWIEFHDSFEWTPVCFEQDVCAKFGKGVKLTPMGKEQDCPVCK